MFHVVIGAASSSLTFVGPLVATLYVSMFVSNRPAADDSPSENWKRAATGSFLGYALAFLLGSVGLFFAIVSMG